MSSAKGNEGGMLGNLKFNTVGREEAATEVLTPQVDSATKMRTIALVVVVGVVLAGIIWVGYQKTGKAIFEAPKVNKPFDTPSHDMNN